MITVIQKKLGITFVVIACSMFTFAHAQINSIQAKLEELEQRITTIEMALKDTNPRVRSCPSSCHCGVNCSCNPCECGKPTAHTQHKKR